MNQQQVKAIESTQSEEVKANESNKPKQMNRQQAKEAKTYHEQSDIQLHPRLRPQGLDNAPNIVFHTHPMCKLSFSVSPLSENSKR